MTSVLAIDGSPRGGGRTRQVLDAMLAGAEAAGATTRVVSLAGGDADIAAAVAATRDVDAFILGGPAYRAAPAAPMKAFIDAMPRGFSGEDESPLTAHAVALVITGSSYHHFLALDGFRSMLAGFFAAHVLSPGFYVAPDSFADGALTEAALASAASQGAALVALARAIESSPELQGIRPQV